MAAEAGDAHVAVEDRWAATALWLSVRPGEFLWQPVAGAAEETQIRAYAAATAACAPLFVELNRSGRSLDRPQLQAALARIHTGASNGLIIHSSPRT